jgi:hypothetical protein
MRRTVPLLVAVAAVASACSHQSGPAAAGSIQPRWPMLWKAIDALVDALHAPKGHE